jgi:tRNA/tmRNA/rRNA uracil-C5-methylase (TrmA/RlmC/RlmD family)
VDPKRAGLAAVGDVLELSVGEAVHGGWCVARPVGPPGTSEFVVFVRHALPAEHVRAVVTQRTARFARADAVEIVTTSPDRVRPPCPYAGPGACGGCDWQHASLAAQRDIKAHVVAQQLRRIAGIDRDLSVEPLPGESDGLSWRTRVRFAVGKDGQAGLRRHRSHQIIEVADCLIAHPLVREAEVTRRTWRGARSVEVAVAPATGQRAVLAPGAAAGDVADGAGTTPLTQRAAGRLWRVSTGTFWQVHPQAADALVAAVLTGLEPRPGEAALDLYCGAGLFAGALAEAVGPGGGVIGIESDAAAAADARHNLLSTPWAQVHEGDAAEVLGRIGLREAAVAVLDPPRAGVPGALIDLLCGAGPTRGGLRRVGYVSCDPATLARDIAAFGARGWRLDELRAFDAFPMTHHVECVAMLAPPV